MSTRQDSAYESQDPATVTDEQWREGGKANRSNRSRKRRPRSHHRRLAFNPEEARRRADRATFCLHEREHWPICSRRARRHIEPCSSRPLPISTGDWERQASWRAPVSCRRGEVLHRLSAALSEEHTGNRNRNVLDLALPEAAHLSAPDTNANGLFEPNHHRSSLRCRIMSNLRARKDSANIHAPFYTRMRNACVGSPTACPIAVA